jgi:2-polyprenyl-6-methoxyphenol hydroxylase-like FAD-dependent oxidoreductase
MQRTNRTGETREFDTPVVIVGGGPVGMTLALSLARYGVKCVLLERNVATTRHPKMDLTNGRSMELYKRLGLVEKLRDAGVPRDNSFDVTWMTSLAGDELHRFRYPSANEARLLIKAKNDGSQASEPGLRVSQIVIEPVLKQAVDANPLIDVRFGTSFEQILENDSHGVTVEVRDSVTGEIKTLACAYLAGCDGGGSRVRRQLGIELEGEMAVAGAYMVHFRTNERDLFRRWGSAWHYQNGAGTIIAQNDDDIYTLQAWLLPGQDPATLKPNEVLENWVGRRFDYEILQANPWTANLVVAERFFQNRVMLAGDSAHQYIPTGGYGMNSGIADTAGLSWVLAALIQGWGGPKLSQAYDAERRPTAWWHLAAARRHMGVRIEIGQAYAAAGELECSSREAALRRDDLGRQIALIGNAENESWGVELGYRYDDSPIIATEHGAPEIDPINYQPSTWPGARLPHVFLDNGESIHDRLGLYFTLLVLDDQNTRGAEAAASDLGIPLAVLRLSGANLRQIYQRNAFLIRPDQHVAWRGDNVPDDVHELLKRVVGR